MPNAFERCGSAVRQAGFVVLTFLALAASGCLDFKRETCVITMNPKTNQAFVLLVYEGLDVSGKSKNDLQKAKDDLKEAFADNNRFYLGAPVARIADGTGK